MGARPAAPAPARGLGGGRRRSRTRGWVGAVRGRARSPDSAGASPFRSPWVGVCCVRRRHRRSCPAALGACAWLQRLERVSRLGSQIWFRRRVSSPNLDAFFPSQPSCGLAQEGWRGGAGVAGGKFRIWARWQQLGSVCALLFPCCHLGAFCSAMPCSEDTLAVSPSKRPRPAEEGGLRLRFVRLSEHATAPTKGSARAAGYDLYR